MFRDTCLEGFEVNIKVQQRGETEESERILEGYNISPMPSLMIEITAGIEMTDDRRVWFKDADIFGTGKEPQGEKPSCRSEETEPRTANKEFCRQIFRPEIMVHESCGIWQVLQVSSSCLPSGTKRDYLKVKYAGTDSSVSR